jgi:hypothetical protein
MMTVLCCARRGGVGVLVITAMAAGLMGCPPEDPGPSADPNPAQRLFQALYRYPTGATPYGVAAGDLNGDGVLDLVTANRASNNVSVLLGQTDGKYALHVDYAAGTAPSMLVLADVNGDGLLDVLTVNTLSDDVSVLLGAGDGTLGAAIQAGLITGSRAAALAVADFNSDSIPDVATADSGTGMVSVLLGVGDGTFGFPALQAVGLGPRWVLAADLNNDGAIDLATANRDSHTVSVLYGLGDGAFAAPLHLDVGTTPRMVAAAYLDGDAQLDLVASNPGSRDLSVILRDGTGAFLPEQRVGISGQPTRFLLTDLTRDGRADVAVLLFGDLPDNEGVVTAQALGVVAVLPGDGAGGFGAARLFGVGPGALDLEAADVNGDTRLDLLAVNPGLNQVAVVLARSSGGFQTDERFAVGQRPRALAAADFDQDGHTDVAATNLESNNVSVLLGNGDGAFELRRTLAVAGIPRAVAAGDINGDEYPDLAVTNFSQSQVSVFLGGRNAVFQAERRFSVRAAGNPYTAQARSLALADMNGDGKTDIVTGNSNTDTVAILLGDGSGGFAAAVEYEAGNFPLDIRVADINRDGARDVVFVSTNDPDVATDGAQPRVVRWLGKGDGTLDETSNQRYTTGPQPRALAIGDLDGDSDFEAVTAHTGDNTVYVLAGRSDGKFTQGESQRAGTGPNTVEIADLNRDALMDVLVTNDNGFATALINRGGLKFLPAMSFNVGTSPIGGILADVNGDGRPDLLTANRTTNDISVLLAN